jgi:hypothetical protein
MSYDKTKVEESYYQGSPVRRYWCQRDWNVSPRRPYVHPQRMAYYRTEEISRFDSRPYGEPNGFWEFGCFDSRSWPDVYRGPLLTNAAYEKFQNQTGDASQWANNLLEARQSIGIVADRAIKVARCFGALRKGRIGDAAKAIGISLSKPQRNRVGRALKKGAPDAFLEMHFGWVPLAQDIHSACTNLTKPDFGRRKITASANDSQHAEVHEQDSNTGTLGRTSRYYGGRLAAKMSAYVRVSNPDGYLANQLGLTNPLSVAWEAVPFSFVADWFGNVGQVIGAITGFVGLSLEDAYTSNFQVQTLNYMRSVSTPGAPPDQWWLNNFVQSEGKVTWFERELGITGPSLSLKPFKGFSPMRGVTAIALLLQTLKS